MFRSSNPALKEDIFRAEAQLVFDTPTMTVQGTVNKSLVLLGLVVLCAGYVWYLSGSRDLQSLTPLMMGGAIVGFVSALAVLFKKQWAPVLAPVYAVAQGFFIGGVSVTLESFFPGIVIQAVGLTFGTLFCLLGAYKSGWIQVTDKFRMGLLSAMGGIAVLYLCSFVLRLFGMPLSFMSGSGVFSIGLSLIVVVVAALNLVLDFDAIESGAKQGAPQYMEWFGAFGLMVTLIWLYMEILILLSKLSGRRDNS